MLTPAPRHHGELGRHDKGSGIFGRWYIADFVGMTGHLGWHRLRPWDLMSLLSARPVAKLTQVYA
jgi:hypothetical protein